jgi:protein-S-isoprenylcysteine O-methyltransferase Ste14
VTSFSAFAIGAFSVFDRSGRPGRGLTAIKVGALGAAVVELAAMLQAPRRPLPAWIAGGLVFALSLGLFVWCVSSTRAKPLTVAYSVDVPVHLNSVGPYRRIRHPFYASYLLAYLGGS